MKLTLFLSMLTVFQLLASETYSQMTKLTLNLENVRIADALREIEDQSEFYFLYSPKLIDVERKVNINSENKTIKDLLEEIFDDKIKFAVFDRQIVLTPNDQSNFLGAFQQKRIINGIVTSKDGVPLPGVNVVISGTTKGTITDSDGKYSIEVPENAKSLVFSFVGMDSQEINIGLLTQINVIMIESSVGLEEVVVVGYGTQKKVNLTGSTFTVTSRSLTDRPIVSTAEGLQGLVPNLNINFSNGDVSKQKVDFNLRGFTSINGGSPYILIDGVPMDIQIINPADIESVTVLKDAASSAIYGGKAGFGVILVTTKRGDAKERIRVQYSNETAVSQPLFKGYDVVDNSYNFVINRNLIRTNDGLSPEFTPAYVAGVKAFYENPTSSPDYAIINGEFQFYGHNNYKELLLHNVAPSMKNNLSISGGTKNISFYISYGNYRKQGLYRYGNDSYKRNNILIKTEEKLNNWLRLDQKITVNITNSDSPHLYDNWDYSIGAVMLAEPTIPIKFPKNDPSFPQYGGLDFVNPVTIFEKAGRYTNNKYDLWLTTGLSVNPIKGLNVRSEFSYNIGNISMQDVAHKIQFVNNKNLGTSSDLYYDFTGNDYISKAVFKYTNDLSGLSLIQTT